MKDSVMRFLKNSNKAFTIIELLVVISIVGLLSSVIVVSVSSARDKGRIASGIQFSSSIYQAKGLELVGEWKFDESGGNTVTDSSGNGNDGISSSGSVTRSTDAPSPNHGKSLSLNGGYHIKIPSSTKFIINNKGFTYSAWIKPTGLVQNSYRFSVVMGKGHPYLAVVQGDWSTLFFKFYDASGGTCEEVELWGIKAIYNNKWQYVTVTLDSNGKAKSYIDGRLDWEYSGTYNNYCDFANSDPTRQKFTIGTWYDDSLASTRFAGFIDEARFYNGAITYSQVQKLYAEGKASHQNN